ncbi:oxidoreductase, partial [Streptomyces pseudogriseolus]
AVLREHAPATVAGYLAMARATADRALAHGLLKPELAEPLLGVLAGPADGAGGPGGTPGNTPGDPS